MRNAIDIIKLSKRIVAISNLKFSEQVESFAKDYDCIIRFNKGSNEKVLKKFCFYNGRIDICCLSGWKNGDFGPMIGFTDKPILFSRPKFNKKLQYLYQKIYIKQTFINNISNHTCNLSFIPWEVFVSFYDKYKYDHPTTGLIVLWFIKNYINTNIDCVNFMQDENLYNVFINKGSSKHMIALEKKILSDMNVNNYII